MYNVQCPLLGLLFDCVFTKKCSSNILNSWCFYSCQLFSLSWEAWGSWCVVSLLAFPWSTGKNREDHICPLIFFHNQEIYCMLWYLFYNQVWTSKKPTIYIYFLWVQEVEHWHKQRPKLQGVEELLHVRGRPRAHREQEETRREGVQGGAEQVDRPSSERGGVRFHFPDAWRQQRWAYQHREWVEVFKVK